MQTNTRGSIHTDNFFHIKIDGAKFSLPTTVPDYVNKRMDIILSKASQVKTPITAIILARFSQCMAKNLGTFNPFDKELIEAVYLMAYLGMTDVKNKNGTYVCKSYDQDLAKQKFHKEKRHTVPIKYIGRSKKYPNLNLYLGNPLCLASLGFLLKHYIKNECNLSKTLEACLRIGMGRNKDGDIALTGKYKEGMKRILQELGVREVHVYANNDLRNCWSIEVPLTASAERHLKQILNSAATQHDGSANFRSAFVKSMIVGMTA